jgi:hypothetical protein
MIDSKTNITLQYYDECYDSSLHNYIVVFDNNTSVWYTEFFPDELSSVKKTWFIDKTEPFILWKIFPQVLESNPHINGCFAIIKILVHDPNHGNLEDYFRYLSENKIQLINYEFDLLDKFCKWMFNRTLCEYLSESFIRYKIAQTLNSVQIHV